MADYAPLNLLANYLAAAFGSTIYVRLKTVAKLAAGNPNTGSFGRHFDKELSSCRKQPSNKVSNS